MAVGLAYYMAQQNLVHQASGVTELVAVGSHVCLPGEPVLLLQDDAVVMMGSGIAKGGPTTIDGVSGEVLVATLCGPMLRERTQPGNPWRYRVLATGRYRPRKGDPVIGTIQRVLPMSYSVAIGAAQLAVLDGVAFDGATKGSRPRLRVGDHVYCHVVACEADTDIVLSCCATAGMEAKEWTTGESVFGLLTNGSVVRVRPSYATELLNPEHVLLALLGGRCAYDVAVGVNGRVWIRGQGADEPQRLLRTVALATCMLESQADQSALEIAARVESFFPTMAASGKHNADHEEEEAADEPMMEF